LFHAASLADAGSAPGDAELAGKLTAIRRRLAELPARESYARQSRYQQQVAADLLARLAGLKAAAGTAPPAWSDVPGPLVTRFCGRSGKHLLKVYGRGNLWDTGALGQFVREVRSVDPRATGHPLQAHEASHQMQRSYEQAALYALAVIAVVLLVDFRSVKHAALAALPLGVGVLAMFGLLGWLNQPLNPANLIALPLILGIGVDYGVHIVHDYLERKGRYQMTPATAVAVLVDALTTIVGFGSLMIASHQGLQSLGRVLTLGVTACLFTSMVMLPALLTWMTRREGRLEEFAREAGQEPPDAVVIEFAPVRRRAA
jgi:hypothetical protein